ncbi:hypothetical protein SAMN04488063_1964 [Halopelagius inordinatus]|uniref:Uncharacterized protein n=1 Tax=Halopelagius inordinatus TaxID=553467 RepID=A0A1I2RRR8_9EURY|nr:hypothetical protein [Halopelagius inordinatus]SFG41307.1 hypothetical protein SAMN04488063_1964 [Halopelagius inordinatus]
MATPPLSEPEEKGQDESTKSADIGVCESSPGKYVFIESGNCDGWIGTDTVVEPWE